MNTEQIWVNFSDKLHAFIRKRISEPDDVQDVLQQVFMRIHLHKGQLKSSHKLAPWVYQITRNAVIDYYRTRKNIYSGELPLNLVEEEREFDPWGCLLGSLQTFLNQLPEEDRFLLKKVDWEGASQKELATTLDIPYSTLKSRVQRARQKLYDIFTDCCKMVYGPAGDVIDVIPRKKKEGTCDSFESKGEKKRLSLSQK